MAIFTKQIHNFLKSIQADPEKEVSIVQKSISCANPGDVTFFRYSLGTGKGSRAMRMVLVVQPIVKEAKTGNLLLTGFKLPDNGTFTPDSLDDLYKNKGIPKENYRTYILNRIYGSLHVIKSKKKTKNDEIIEKKVNNGSTSTTTNNSS